MMPSPQFALELFGVHFMQVSRENLEISDAHGILLRFGLVVENEYAALGIALSSSSGGPRSVLAVAPGAAFATAAAAIGDATIAIARL